MNQLSSGWWTPENVHKDIRWFPGTLWQIESGAQQRLGGDMQIMRNTAITVICQVVDWVKHPWEKYKVLNRKGIFCPHVYFNPHFEFHQCGVRACSCLKRPPTYIASHKLPDHAENEVSPEYVQKLEHQQHCVEEVVSKESRVLQDRVDPSTVDEPKTQEWWD